MSLSNDKSVPLPKTSLPEESLSEEEPLLEEETAEGYKRIVLMPDIQQMMFVAGETGEPSSETTTLIEQIVHEQVTEMVGLSISVKMRN